MARIWAVVPAARRGTRFGGELPKQYLVVDGAPLIAHTLAALFAHDAVDAGGERPVRCGTVGEMKSEVLHATGAYQVAARTR